MKRARRHPEHDLQEAVAKFLDLALPADAFWTSVDHGSKLGETKQQAAQRWSRLKKRGVKPGLPDVWILYRGQLTLIELKKSKSAPLTDTQIETANRLSAAWANWHKAWTLEMVETICLVDGIPLRARVSA